MLAGGQRVLSNLPINSSVFGGLRNVFILFRSFGEKCSIYQRIISPYPLFSVHNEALMWSHGNRRRDLKPCAELALTPGLSSLLVSIYYLRHLMCTYSCCPWSWFFTSDNESLIFCVSISNPSVYRSPDHFSVWALSVRMQKLLDPLHIQFRTGTIINSIGSSSFV